ncbi:accessory factor UbiK family protein [Zoogloea sp. LCSB751]|uniref:accessory factor UbiK family protein n=1 Tax=Zoogloea sp. LCSB751 TaxID=1965277 RepID=UPI0009A4C9C2|nr:accessory factor UbiK family protein [Zoogloea sp. LCSB751]
MANPKILDEIGSKVSELLANSPAKDLEKNARALLASGFSKLDLVTREEFELQKEALTRYRDKLTELEHRVAQLEAELASRPPAEAG